MCPLCWYFAFISLHVRLGHISYDICITIIKALSVGSGRYRQAERGGTERKDISQ